MKKSQIQVGKVYAVKVSGRIQPVRLTGESPYGGWDGRNETSGRSVRIHSAAKLRFEVAQTAGKWYSTMPGSSWPERSGPAGLRPEPGFENQPPRQSTAPEPEPEVKPVQNPMAIVIRWNDGTLMAVVQVPEGKTANEAYALWLDQQDQGEDLDLDVDFEVADLVRV